MIYLDVLFVYNFILDHLILILVKEKHFPDMRKRRVTAGAFLAALTYLFWFCLSGNVSMLPRVATAGILLCFTLIWTYRIRTWRLFKKTVETTMLYSFLLGGLGIIFQKIMYRLPVLDVLDKAKQSGAFLFFVTIFTIFFIVKERGDKKIEKREEYIYEVQIIRKDRSIFLDGYYDTGNLLVSEMTGLGICILSYKEAEKILDEKEKKTMECLIRQKEFPWKEMADHLRSGIYKINYSSVGKEDGWMPGILAEHIIVKKDGEILADRRGLMGMTIHKVSRDGRYNMLLPADIFVS
ncbi:MAG: sigma-E processing peptidase SpoIIGA [Clostridiales bacterium]|nr:sigma-E processing peptidase SpoIIGA [Clostridiales bacterium]